MIAFLRIAVILIFATSNTYGQAILDIPLSKMRHQPLSAFLVELEQQHRVKAFFLEEWLTGYDVGPQFEGYTLGRMLDELLRDSGISYSFMFDYALVFSKDPAAAIQREAILNRAVVQRKTVERKTIGHKTNYKPNRPVILKGLVRDQDTDKALEGSVVTLNEKQEVITDAAGRFQFSVLPGVYVLTLHLPQYDDKVIDIELYESGDLTLELQETPIMLSEVVISDEMILDKAIGKTSLDVTQIKRVPVFLGEVDVIKQVQMQPGVTTVGEIASGFNVRGGSVDQNLVLYDDVPIFNTSHALGFFTAFNPDAIGEVSFYRGGIPAQYGGRASSVLNIVSRQGNSEKWTGSGGIGIISSHLTVGGPIKLDTTSILVSLRSTYSNWMLQSIKSNYQNLANTSVRFFDGSIKLTHQFTERSKLTLSGYRSNDEFTLTNDTSFQWTNTAAALKFDYAITGKFFSSTSLTYGMYNFQVSERDVVTAFDLDYSIIYPALKIDLHIDGKHDIDFGFHNTWYRFNPGAIKRGSEISNARERYMNVEESLETAAYISDGFNISEKLFMDAGVRVSMFNRFGPATVYRYPEHLPREVRNIEDSTVYSAGEISKSYLVIEPRASFRYNLGPSASLKIGYHRMAQYMHLVTNSAAITPMDIWQSSNAYFRPQIADQLSAGVFRNFFNNSFETFLEVYYKQVSNTLDFKDGAELILNRYLETSLISTTGTSYGAEFSVAKVTGRLQGSFNYSFSRSYRKGDSRFDAEQINGGRQYPANHDQPHVTNLNWRYGISRRIFFSGNFVYHTGRPVSMPTAVYNVDGVPISDFSERNQFRIPDYHRLDVAFIIEGNHKRKKPWSGHWVFSFYNVYGRKNAYSVFFADDGNGVLKPFKLSVIGTVIPSVSYSFKF